MDYKDRCLFIVYLVLIYILLLNEMYSKLSIVS